MWQPSWYSMPSFNWKIRSWKLQEEGYQKQWISYSRLELLFGRTLYLTTWLQVRTPAGWWLDASILILVRLHHDTLVCLCPHCTIILLLFDLHIVSCLFSKKKSKSYYDLLERLFLACLRNPKALEIVPSKKKVPTAYHFLCMCKCLFYEQLGTWSPCLQKKRKTY